MTPALLIAPLITAAAGIGAAGYASGNQTCSGTSPTFSPKPTIRKARVASRQGDVGSSATAPWIARLLPGVAAASSAKPISRQTSLSTARPR